MSETTEIQSSIFKSNIQRFFRADWLAVVLILLMHIFLSFIFRTIALVALWLWLYLLLHKQGRQKIGLLAPDRWQWWLAAPVVGFALIGITSITLSFIWGWGEKNMLYDMTNFIQDALQGNAPQWSLVALIAFGWLFQSPFLEEPLFRGLILDTFAEKWGFYIALLIQATIFALLHPLNSISWFLSIFVAGIVYGVIVRNSKSIFPAILAHSTYNLGILLIAFNHF